MCVGFLFLPEQGQSRPVFPLRSLHTDSVCRYPRPSDASVGGSHHFYGNPTRDASTRLRVRLFPLLCESTRYPFQGSRCLHPFVASVDGLLGVEATATLKRIASRLASKWKQPYSQTCGCVTSRVAITLVQATYQCIRGLRVPTHRISVQIPQWEDGAGLALFR